MKDMTGDISYDVDEQTNFGAYTDFGRLRAAIVGSADGLALPPFNPTLHHYNDEVQAALRRSGDQALLVAEVMPERWHKTVEQLDQLAALYESNGVQVYRPRPYSEEETEYLAHLQPGHSLLYPADPVYTLGKRYFELNIRRAYRRKEVFPLREIVAPMISSDAEASHVVMPAPQPFEPSSGGPGPYLEGGDIICYQNHVFVGESDIASNRAGTDWLESHITPEYQMHRMPMKGTVLHLLGAMVLIREGLLILYRDELNCDLPEPLKDWDVIEISEAEARAYATVGVSLDDERYIIPAGLHRVNEELDRRGVQPIPIDFEHVGYWGGCVSCATQAISRDP
jgi:glycine amidinotransferase|tara:strand:+ start:303 stop:1322 length:1020 start_codon:yes stop_codon:yes gene_type:complete